LKRSAIRRYHFAGVQEDCVEFRGLNALVIFFDGSHPEPRKLTPTLLSTVALISFRRSKYLPAGQTLYVKSPAAVTFPNVVDVCQNR
jgi:hypothetical protein